MRLSGLLALPILFVSLPAAADECASPADCGFGFTCLTTVTSPGSGTGGGNSGAAYGGTTGATTGGTGAYLGGAGGTVGNGGSSGSLATGGFAGTSGASGASGTTATGGVSGTSGTSGSGGTATTPPPPTCGNALCEPGESPANCTSDCVFSTICSPATCIDDAACAPGYYCPPSGSGSGGIGGAPIATFCGDGLCTVAETAFDCPFDCDPNLRHCAPGGPGCHSNLDCAPGYLCEFSGPTSGDAAPATGGYPGMGGFATGGGAGVGTAGIGTGGIGTGGGTSGAGGAPVGGASGSASGGSAGYPSVGMCVPSGTGGTGGTEGGTSGTGGDYYGGTSSTTGGQSGRNMEGDTPVDDERVVVTHGGCLCSLSGASEPSSLGALVFAAAAFFGVTRRRSRRATRTD